MSIRNSPCPCHSGKKYKKCCLRAASKEAGEVLTSQLHFLATKPKCLICGDANPSEMGNYSTKETVLQYAICAKCAKIPNVNLQIMNVLERRVTASSTP